MEVSTKESEVNLTIMSDKLSDKSYIDYMLVTTKLQILADIAKNTEHELKTLVGHHCSEAYNYADLVDKYNLEMETVPITVSPETTITPDVSAKPPIKKRRRKKSDKPGSNENDTDKALEDVTVDKKVESTKQNTVVVSEETPSLDNPEPNKQDTVVVSEDVAVEKKVESTTQDTDKAPEDVAVEKKVESTTQDITSASGGEKAASNQAISDTKKPLKRRRKKKPVSVKPVSE